MWAILREVQLPIYSKGALKIISEKIVGYKGSPRYNIGVF